MGLERVLEVLDRLALQPPAGRVLTVAGTNGKGSTITLLHDCLRAAGGNPGLYTSPHLVRYNERIRIAGRPVSDDALIQAFERVELARKSTPLTYFEFGTLAALTSFAAAGCDTWLLEVGLGGRLDAVNGLDADVAMITTIGLDHQEWLGSTIEAIAREKAGILRAGKPAFFGDYPLPDAIRAEAVRVGADLEVYGADFRDERVDADGGWAFVRRGGCIEGLRAPDYWTPAQYRNAALALSALTRLMPLAALTAAFLNPVVLKSNLPGRFQLVRREHDWILDVAHNPQAASVLRQQLAKLPKRAAVPHAPTIVLALLSDKPVTEFVAELAPVAGQWIVSGVDDPRASTEARMRDALAAGGVNAVAWEPAPAAAFERARLVTPAGGRIVVCGSFRIVAPALQWLGL